MNIELKYLVRKYKRGDYMTFAEYGRMLELLLNYYDTHNRHINDKKIRRN